MFTPQDFSSMFGHFTTLCMKGLKTICGLLEHVTMEAVLTPLQQSAMHAQVFVFKGNNSHGI